MKTISSDKNLVVWKRNKNESNIELPVLGGDQYFLKPMYSHLFVACADILKTKKIASFVKTWQKLVDDECQNVKNSIRNATRDFKVSDSALDLVVNKFRGNAGEILVEMLAENGMLSNICKPGTYTPVDPDNERFIDAEGIRNGMPVGIQIKNYNAFSFVKHETFIKSAAMDSIWIRQEKRPADLGEFISTPGQYIISLSETQDIFCEMYRNIVVFLGPKWFESLKIQGSIKTGESAKWQMFRETAQLIDSCR